MLMHQCMFLCIKTFRCPTAGSIHGKALVAWFQWLKHSEFAICVLLHFDKFVPSHLSLPFVYLYTPWGLNGGFRWENIHWWYPIYHQNTDLGCKKEIYFLLFPAIQSDTWMMWRYNHSVLQGSLGWAYTKQTAHTIEMESMFLALAL